MHLRGALRTSHYCDYLSELEEKDLHFRSHRSGTLSTNSMPICLHLPLRIVLLWYLPKGGFSTCPPQVYGVSKVLSAESLYGVLVFYQCPHVLNYSEGFVLHLTLLNVYRFKYNAKI